MLAAWLLLIVASQASAASNNEYWNFANQTIPNVDARWNENLGAFVSHHGPLDTRLNSNMLQLYALAALNNQTGLVRHDDRARKLVSLLLKAPAYVTSAKSTSGSGLGVAHYPGWTGNASGGARGEMHMSIDPKVAEAMAAAWKARNKLGLSSAQSKLIADCITKDARSSLFKFPTPTLNQWNWAGEMWMHAAEVSGDWSTATVQYRQQIVRFLTGVGATQSGMKSPNLNQGYGFMYGPEFPASQWPNTANSTEYGNIVFSGLAYYDKMVAHGMPRLSSREEELLRLWSQRTLFGEWTHSGYTNWDTGLGYLRWHLMRYWAWSMSGLLSLGAQDILAFNPSQKAWASSILDNSLALYSRWAIHDGGLPGYQFDIPGTFSMTPDDDGLLNATRFAIIAAQAADQGWGEVLPVQPPGMFAHDPDIKRLAVSTPNYSTSLLQAQQETGYGGLELNRLFDGQANPVSGVAGRQEHAFGIIVRRSGQSVLLTQPGKLLGYTRSAWGLKLNGNTVSNLQSFQDGLTATAWIQSNSGDKAVVSHRFDADSITTTRTITGRGGTLNIYLPVWGSSSSPAGLSSTPKVYSGALIAITSSEGGGYTAGFAGLPASTTISLQSTAPQPGNPHGRYAVVLIFPVSDKGISFTQTIHPA